MLGLDAGSYTVSSPQAAHFAPLLFMLVVSASRVSALEMQLKNARDLARMQADAPTMLDARDQSG